MPEHKEDIKNRMIRNAARLWGYSEISSENEFDPLISMLLDVNAAEFERVNNEISSSRARILERMMQMLTPEILTSARPAHAIAHVESIQPIGRITVKEQFLASKQTQDTTQLSKIENNDIYLAPTQSYIANQAKIRHVLIGSNLYEYKRNVGKELVYTDENIAHNLGNHIWISLQNVSTSLSGTHFFFNAPVSNRRDNIYSFLPDTKWYARNAQLLTTIQGYQQEDAWQKELPVEDILLMQRTVNKSFDNSVNDFYRQQFITITDEHKRLDITDRRIPPILVDLCPSEMVEGLNSQNLVWIRIQFPEYIELEKLELMNFYSNCIPVANKQLYSRIYELNEYVNVLPLHTDSTFFDIESITDSEGHRINTRNIRSDATEEVNALLRYGGIARFDEREASLVIQNILQLLRDESASFDILGSNFITGEIKSLQQILNKLEQRLLQKDLLKESVPYLVISTKDKEKRNERSNLFVEYWSTAGVLGNGLVPNTHLTPYKSGDVNHSEVYLITSTLGGKNKLPDNEKINAYKYALLSHNRIVSQEDIMLFCKLQFGDTLHKVTIEKGMIIDSDPTKGYAKTIDIHVFLEKIPFLRMKDKNEIAFWEGFLLKEIQKNAQTLTPYRIFLKEAA